ncbi:MAG: YHYH domain-containing protein [Gammaproteobacteria bacterium]|nr:YHYH domain-containing protein [Gammaproteobacteria bacterium]
MRNRIALGLAVALLMAVPAASHSGGTNAAGCHTNRSTGDYHCHTPRSSSPSSSPRYCHVIDGQRRCGYACRSLVRQFGGSCELENR